MLENSSVCTFYILHPKKAVHCIRYCVYPPVYTQGRSFVWLLLSTPSALVSTKLKCFEGKICTLRNTFWNKDITRLIFKWLKVVCVRVDAHAKGYMHWILKTRLTEREQWYLTGFQTWVPQVKCAVSLRRLRFHKKHRTREGTCFEQYQYPTSGRVGVFKPWTLDKRIHDRPRFRIRPRFRNVYKTY